MYHVKKRLDTLIYEDSKRHIMDSEPTWLIASIEDEILPALEKFLFLCEDEPTDEEMGYGSEPPLTADEMHTAAWKEHQRLHS